MAVVLASRSAGFEWTEARQRRGQVPRPRRPGPCRALHCQSQRAGRPRARPLCRAKQPPRDSAAELATARSDPSCSTAAGQTPHHRQRSAATSTASRSSKATSPSRRPHGHALRKTPANCTAQPNSRFELQCLSNAAGTPAPSLRAIFNLEVGPAAQPQICWAVTTFAQLLGVDGGASSRTEACIERLDRGIVEQALNLCALARGARTIRSASRPTQPP